MTVVVFYLEVGDDGGDGETLEERQQTELLEYQSKTLRCYK